MIKSVTNECFINGVQYKCRTCFDPAATVYPLVEECSNSKTWKDLLNDIVQLKINDDELLPKTICTKCLDKLISYYDFILYVQKVNEKYHQLLASGKLSSQNDCIASSSRNITECLAESATALPLDRSVSEIKFEDELIMSYDIVLNSNDRRNDSVKEEDTCDPYMETLNEDIELSSDNMQYEQRSLNEELDQVFAGDVNDYDSQNSSTSTADESKKKEDEMNKSGSSSSSESENDVRRSQPFEKKTDEEFLEYFPIEKVDGYYVCGVCKHSFALHSTCHKHILIMHSPQKFFQCGFCDKNLRCKAYLMTHLKRMHPGESFESNKKQLEHLFGERLYSKPFLLPRAECKLCDSTFTTKKTLLQHLDKHSEVSTLDSLNLSSDIIQRWFSNMSDLQVIKTMICEDIREKNWVKYYTILNDFSYEISMSDTDAEDLEEETEVPAKKYNCELCSKGFFYKHQVFAHMREDHLNEETPLKCIHCKLEFISIKMYEQHKETHCRNEHKLLNCQNCPGKFVWPQNMKKHNCVTKILHIEKSLKYQIGESDNEVIRSSPVTIIRCGLCEITFKKLRDLRQHITLHADGKTGVDFNGCIYVNQFETSSSNRELLEQKIKNAFTKRQISQLYQAIDKDGKEMDISDSDTDEDDADGEKNYLCELCYETFKKRKLLFNHQKEQHEDFSMPFTCKECKMQYVSIDLLQQHLKRECWNEHRRAAEQCDCCKERFIWPENMLRHKEIQLCMKINKSLSEDLCDSQAKKTIAASNSNSDAPGANIQISHCFVCPKTFSNTDYLNEHLMRHRFTPSTIKTIASTIHSICWKNSLKIIQCKICNEEFRSIDKLKEHYSKNIRNLCGTRQHSLANYSITNEMGFELNLELDSETETDLNKNRLPYRCCMCGKSFKRKFEITQHQIWTHNYEMLELKCERCVFRTVSQKVLDYHRMSQCFDVEKKYQCDQCNFKFMWQKSLQDHISVFHTSNVFVKPLNYNHLYTYKRPCKCTICSKIFQLPSHLASHMRYHSIEKPKKQPTGLTKYKKCPICGVHRKHIASHVRRHKSETPLKCDRCDKVFKTEMYLYIHQRLQACERRFKCTYCEKSFSHECRLKAHIPIHTGERPYQCNVCQKKYLHKGTLSSHLLKHSGKKH